jgi:sortase A
VTKNRASPLRSVLRFVASVMMLSGALLIADAGMTLLWQEPVSAFLAQRQQVQLEQALADPVVVKRVVHRRPLKGDAIGRIMVPTAGVDDYVVEGTDTESLRKGPGHYPDTPLPGGTGTTAIAGHRTTYGAPFRHLDDVEPGNRIIVDMPDHRYVYRVTKVEIVDDEDLSVLNAVGYKQLILSACHPLYSAAQRIIVFARQIARTSSRVKRA